MSRATSLVLAALVVVFSACSGASSDAHTSHSFAGRWVLQSVNGGSLPFATSQSAVGKTELVSDVIGATSSGSFTDTMIVRTTQSGQVATKTVPRSGIWVLDGSTVTFTFFDDGLSTAASFDGKALTVSASGKSYLYHR